jgi:hypothetical protein
MEESNENFPKWYFRSDNNPLDTEAEKITWQEFFDSEIIENAYSDYMVTLNENPDEIDNYKVYEVSELSYSIDFEQNLQFHNENNIKSRLVGRFIGDPSNTQNTLQKKEILFHLLERKANNIIGNNNRSIKSSLILESNQAFIDYLFLDLVFQITDKSQNENQAKKDLYMFSIVHINSYENDKQQQLKELKHFKDDIYKGRLKNNSLIWYTKDSFVYRMVNTVLRKQNYVEIFWIRYLINVLRKSIESMSSINQTKTLFRGTILSKEEFEFMNKSIGKPFFIKRFYINKRRF